MRYQRPLLGIVAVIAVAVLTLGVAGIAGAGETQPEYIVTIESVSCTQLIFSYFLTSESSGGADFAEWLVDVIGEQTIEGFGSPYDDTIAVPLDLDPGTYSISVTVQIPQYAIGSASTRITCEGGEEPSGDVDFGRVCFGPGAVPATLFYYPNRIEIYAIDGSDNGELVMFFTQTYLNTLPSRPSGPAVLIGDSDRHIPIEFYRNSNGLYRIVAGPDAEDKYFECTFGGACSAERSWIGAANAPTDEVVPVCAPPVVSTPAPTPTMEPTIEPSAR